MSRSPAPADRADRVRRKLVSDLLRNPLRKPRPELKSLRKPLPRVVRKPLPDDAADGGLLLGRELGRFGRLLRKLLRKRHPGLKYLRKPLPRLVHKPLPDDAADGGLLLGREHDYAVPLEARLSGCGREGKREGGGRR